MPASLPGATLAQNNANPSQGAFVIFNPLSGPKGSPLDKDSAGNCSTGAMSTGIGYGASRAIDPISHPLFSNVVWGIRQAGFDDDETAGVTNPAGAAVQDGTLLFIGGGRSNANGTPNPYTAGIAIFGAGNGGSRDAGAGPAFTGFAMKMVTAAAGVAAGADIEAGFANRTGVAMTANQSAFGSSTTAAAAVA